MITDLFMPQQDGLETILALRKLNMRLPIIAISGGGSAAQFDMLRTASLFGATRVLMKPFRADEVLAAVREVLPAKAVVVPDPKADDKT
ncbi:MAG: response regulator, partial [Kiritimatiellaeota bacterium]|nr:response regulator [Kiritimatiellota bacterium]